MTTPPTSPRQTATPALSFTEMTEIVLPQHANALGSMFGGQLMAWIDICAAIAAQRFCGRTAVTAAVDELVFLRPIRVGNIVRLESRVTGAFRSSVEVEVRVEVEDVATRQRELCVRSFLTFVALDAELRPSDVPRLQPETEEDVRREREAHARRAARLARRSTTGTEPAA